MSERNHLAQLMWRSRRGLLELDLWLGQFVQREFPGLLTAERMQYERLLNCSDPELMDMLEGRVEPPQELASLILRIRQTDTIHHEH